MSRTRWGRVLLAGVGAAHLVPATALTSRERVEATYGIVVADPSVELLLRHRAVFFGLTGAGLILAAGVPGWRRPAIGAGVLSLASYIGLTQSIGVENSRLRQIQRLDVGLVAALLAAAFLTAEE